MILPIEVLIALVVWGTLVGVDLVSLPQMMIARPLVAGTVAGAILGDIPTGLKLGVVFELLQRVNSRIVHAAAAQLESGDPRALVRIHVGGLLRDALRAALVTMVGLVLAWLARPLLAGALTVRGALLLAVAAVGTALAAGASGTLRLVGRGPNLAWFAAGLGGGILATIWVR